jgi:hypothetical protein
VRHRIDVALLGEIREHRLRFTCADCLHALADGSCAHGWPNREHRRAPGPSDLGKVLVFCKEFDLR